MESVFYSVCGEGSTWKGFENTQLKLYGKESINICISDITNHMINPFKALFIGYFTKILSIKSRKS